jgi:hypothetical protein
MRRQFETIIFDQAFFDGIPTLGLQCWESVILQSTSFFGGALYFYILNLQETISPRLAARAVDRAMCLRRSMAEVEAVGYPHWRERRPRRSGAEVSLSPLKSQAADYCQIFNERDRPWIRDERHSKFLFTLADLHV